MQSLAQSFLCNSLYSLVFYMSNDIAIVRFFNRVVSCFLRKDEPIIAAW